MNLNGLDIETIIPDNIPSSSSFVQNDKINETISNSNLKVSENQYIKQENEIILQLEEPNFYDMYQIRRSLQCMVPYQA